MVFLLLSLAYIECAVLKKTIHKLIIIKFIFSFVINSNNIIIVVVVVIMIIIISIGMSSHPGKHTCIASVIWCSSRV